VEFDEDEPQVADIEGERVAWAFSVLGLEQAGCTEGEVTKAFRELALKHHPDRGGDGAMFSRLQEAKDIALKHSQEG
jgi:DnaJ family protein A protein 2